MMNKAMPAWRRSAAARSAEGGEEKKKNRHRAGTHQKDKRTAWRPIKQIRKRGSDGKRKAKRVVRRT